VPVSGEDEQQCPLSMHELNLGTGWYGLVAARTYLRLRPAANLLIIDSDNTVGGVWSKDRLYPNLVAQVKLGVRMKPSPAVSARTADSAFSYSTTQTLQCHRMEAIPKILE
jgi:cation diffusion facilitator CzcD-associated flavoprotein CzcO